MKSKIESKSAKSKSVNTGPAPVAMPKALPSPSRPAARTPSYTEIEARARVLWQEKGCPEGRDEEIWLQAEQDLARRPAGGGRNSIDADLEWAEKLETRLDEIADPAPSRSPTSL